MEKSGFFNSEQDASGNYDREYLAEDFASYFARFIGNGVFPNPSTGLQILAQAIPDMTISLSPGYAYINGYTYENNAPLTFAITVADGVLNRIDSIFIRYNKLGRVVKAFKVAGTPAPSPVAPDILRTDDYWDLCVANIKINAGITAIPQALIIDTRLDNSKCGIVSGVVSQVSTTTLYNQIQSDLAQFKNVSQAEFDAWFQAINDKLGTEPATALQLQVDALKASDIGINQDISEIINGTTIVAKATDASNAINATNATNAVNASKLNNKAESALSVAAAVNANNSAKLNNKDEGALAVASAGYAGSAPWGGISGKPSTFPPSWHQQDASTITAGTFPQRIVAAAEGEQWVAVLRNSIVVGAGTNPATLGVPVGTLIAIKG